MQNKFQQNAYRVRGKFYKAFGIGSARCGITLLPTTYKNGTTKTSKELAAQLQEVKFNVLMSTMVVLVDPRAMTSDNNAPLSTSASMADIHDDYVDLHVAWIRMQGDNPNQVFCTQSSIKLGSSKLGD